MDIHPSFSDHSKQRLDLVSGGHSLLIFGHLLCLCFFLSWEGEWNELSCFNEMSIIN
jgi:hypothetical protein